MISVPFELKQGSSECLLHVFLFLKSQKESGINEDMTAVSHKADTNEDSIQNLKEELESRDKKIDTFEREIDDLRN